MAVGLPLAGAGPPRRIAASKRETKHRSGDELMAFLRVRAFSEAGMDGASRGDGDRGLSVPEMSCR